MANLQVVDWSSLPEPIDDGAAKHLPGMDMPNVELPSTANEMVNLGKIWGWSILFFYPMTGQPGTPLPEGWDEIPGARGCTPQTCAFRDFAREFSSKGIRAVYGISTQTTEYQLEAAKRLHLPFPLLSDTDLILTKRLKLPTFRVNDMVLIKRLTLVLKNSEVKRLFYPVFPPDQNPADVLRFLDSAHIES